MYTNTVTKRCNNRKSHTETTACSHPNRGQLGSIAIGYRQIADSDVEKTIKPIKPKCRCQPSIPWQLIKATECPSLAAPLAPVVAYKGPWSSPVLSGLVVFGGFQFGDPILGVVYRRSLLSYTIPSF